MSCHSSCANQLTRVMFVLAIPAAVLQYVSEHAFEYLLASDVASHERSLTSHRCIQTSAGAGLGRVHDARQRGSLSPLQLRAVNL